MPPAPIILVPGFWLGAWAWDDVAGRLRADGHDVTALTLPGLRVRGRGPIGRSTSRTTSTRSSGRRGRPGQARPRRPQRDGVQRVRGERPHPGPDRGDGLRRHGAGQGRRSTRASRATSRWSGRRSTAEENLDRPDARSSSRRSASAPCRSPATSCARATSSPTTPATTSRRRSSRPASAPPTTRPTPRSIPSGRSWPACRSCATSSTSTCRRATGRCGRSRPSWREIIGRVATAARVVSASTSPWHDAIEHHVWATERVLETCAALSREQLVATRPGHVRPDHRDARSPRRRPMAGT